MKQIPGTILAVFVFAWLTFLGVGLINGQMTIHAADSYLSDVTKEISESNFSPDVIGACGTQAETSGYDMKITLYTESGTKTVITGASAPALDDYVLAEVQLDYDYQISAIGLDQTHTIRSIVR